MEAESPSPAAPSPPAAVDTSVLSEFMYRLGQGYLACGEQTAKVEIILRRMASAYGMRRSRIVAFPTAIFISLHDSAGERVTLGDGETQAFRLDQMAEIYRLGEEAQKARVAPSAGLERLAVIRRQKARFGPLGMVAGHTILTTGLAFVLMPTLVNIGVAAILGLLVGLLKLLNRTRSVLSVPMPVIAATLVSTVVFLAIRHGLRLDPVHALIPPLITFLPGAMLTLGMVELAYGDMVSGSSRLITGFIQLVLLAFGLAVGAAIIGYLPQALVFSAGGYMKLPFAPWVGVLVLLGIGVFLHFSAPKGSFHWMILVLLLAFSAQRIATVLVGSQISGFFGTLIATPLAYLIELRFRGPPAAVTYLPSFWLLVPGALGLLSVTRIMSDRAAGIDGLITVMFVITSVALGSLVGASIYRALTEVFGAWSLQIGRVGSYFRRGGKR